MPHSLYDTLQRFETGAGIGQFYSLPALGRALGVAIERLPVSIRIVLESVLRNYDEKKITQAHIQQLAQWKANAPRTEEIPFVVARVVLQDFTGVPLLVDLAAMRDVAKQLGCDPKRIEPLVPVDLVVDHSVQVDYFGRNDALDLNMKLEFSRNKERYQFLKWGMQAFDTFRVVPPGVGIVHQVNLEFLAHGVYSTKVRAEGIEAAAHAQGDTDAGTAAQEGRLYYPDTLVGTDSHTTMINGIGVVGWGVGGIEAEAAMLGQPVYLLTPDVVGFELKGSLREGVTATDLVLTITERLRQEKVVGKFVEFFGEGVSTLALPDRATISNMAPEYGATMGFFTVDDQTLAYFRATGRTEEEIAALRSYFEAQGLFGTPQAGEIDYSQTLSLDLASVAPSVAGPKRPQDRIEVGALKQKFTELFAQPVSANGFGNDAQKLTNTYTTDQGVALKNGDILIAAITSCTNTSNPSVLIAAGLLAKKAVEAGLTVSPHIKTSLAPGSRVVTEYLRAAGLMSYLEKLGFNLAAYGCTTCIGNAGDLTADLNAAIAQHDVVAAAVLSGNRNFEARIHPNIRANFLASPPLVVAYALAGTILCDIATEPLGWGYKNPDQAHPDTPREPIYLRDLWPSQAEIQALMPFAQNGERFRENYAHLTTQGDLWSQIQGGEGQNYPWPDSTYIARPPFFDHFELKTLPTIAPIQGARVLAIFGDSLTTDHISPAGSIAERSPAGQWLQAHDVPKSEFNSYGSRRGHHEVMMRGTFANVRIKNLMLPVQADGSRTEGGMTAHQPDGEVMSIYDAAMRYIQEGTPTVIFGGEEYGTGSSRDWAAKGTQLLGVKAVIARSFERIHRSNLVGLGVLPLQFENADSAQSLGIRGDERFDLEGLNEGIVPQQKVTLVIHRAEGVTQKVPLILRIDTPIEVDYYKQGGILPFVLRHLLS